MLAFELNIGLLAAVTSRRPMEADVVLLCRLAMREIGQLTESCSVGVLDPDLPSAVPRFATRRTSQPAQAPWSNFMTD